MKAFHFSLFLLGLGVQTFGWVIAPKRLKGLLAGLALGLGAAWFLWYLADDRSFGVSGFWSLTPMATWVCVHLVLAPVLGVEALARKLARRRWWVRCAGLALILGGYAWCLGEAYGPPVVTEEQLSFPDLPPAFEGYRIALVGDIHAGPYAGTRTLGRWERAIQALHPDLVVAAGDFIANRAEEAERTGVAFETFSAPDGRLGCLGNHDQRPGLDVGQRLRRHGWVILEDESWSVTRAGQRLVFLGARYEALTPEDGAVHWRDRPWPEGFRIGICHTPVMWNWMIKAGARLTLAAHTHGGQVNLSPVFNMAEESTPYVHGLYRSGPAALFVTRGLGVTQFPLRFRCRSEIALITLHRG